ncbi:MAG TPA: phosphoenolpyruvate--protein phosphotransferase [Opitutaceae bacterium]|nr:phosphoenolpyruvate--protein phosphotransferase [Opitutaceae bacterium]
MPQDLSFSFPLPNGLHARPASHFAELVRRYQSAVTLQNDRTGRTANAASVLDLVGTDTRSGDACRLAISGPDEVQAAGALRRFVAAEFLHCDAPLVAERTAPAEVVIPRSLRAAGLAEYHVGEIACAGIGTGAAVVVSGFEIVDAPPGAASSDATTEAGRFATAVEKVEADLQGLLAQARSTEAAVLRAHLAILRDPLIGDTVRTEIQGGATAATALHRALDVQRARLGSAESAYVRERVLDLEDIAARLLEKLEGRSYVAAVPRLLETSVVFAARLTPGQFLALDPARLGGLVLEQGGRTSHTVILARSRGVPTLTGVHGAAGVGRNSRAAVVDAELGLVVRDPTAGVAKFYNRQVDKLTAISRALLARRDASAATADRQRIEIGANIATVEDATAAFANGAEGVGLFRTELLFMDRATAPGEDEQYEAYAAVARAAAGRPVIIRTLDAGGDKPVPFLPFPPEANPFLGYRGVRFYAEQRELIGTQLRAIVRAAAHGPVKILVPMISRVEEARAIRGQVATAVAAARSAGHPVPDDIPVGFMLEVPSVAFILDELCAEADFFSLGTNDLAQYFAAADRENPRVAELNDPLQPGFIRLLAHLVTGVKRHGRWIGLCGELGEKPAALPLLVGLGLDEISLASPRIPGLKAALARLDSARCRELLREAVACPTQASVRALLESAGRPVVPLLTADLVLDDVVAETKEEVIRMMVDALHLTGRTTDPAAVEGAIWAREDTYSTGFGEGFALPHAKTDALAANSIVLARLRRPVEWGALDGKPVDTVILLGIRASEHGKAHLETLARLSRSVARDEFRAAIRAEREAASLVALVQQAGAAFAVAKPPVGRESVVDGG